jgi:hypothetical protein
MSAKVNQSKRKARGDPSDATIKSSKTARGSTIAGRGGGGGAGEDVKMIGVSNAVGSNAAAVSASMKVRVVRRESTNPMWHVCSFLVQGVDLRVVRCSTPIRRSGTR